MHTSAEQLEQWLTGELPAAETARLDRHLSECEACRTSLEGLEAGYHAVVRELRAPRPDAPYIHEPACRDMVLRAAGYDGTIAEESTRETSPGLVQREMVRDYRLLKPLGSGGMGTVYQAVHTKLNRVVALKLLPREKLTSAAVARFEREMQVIGRLEHPNIVRATDAGVVDGTPFLAMELVAGVDLERLVRERGPLSVAAACAIVRQAALGLQHAFERGVIHRDLKPSNLMLGRATHGDWQVKILDLGLALFDEPPPGADELTSHGQLMGTVDYMAPEQGENTHVVDIRADLYSLGATLFMLLTGVPPLADGSRTTTLKKLTALASIDPPDIRTLRPEVPQTLAWLLRRLLAKSPEQRPARPVELAELLAPFATGVDLGTVGQDPSGMPELEHVRPGRLSPNCSPPKATGFRRAMCWTAVATLALAGLLAVMLLRFRTTEGLIIVELETPTPIERILVDDQSVEWSRDDDGQSFRLQVQPGPVASIVLTTRGGMTLHAKVPQDGLTIASGQSYRLTAKLEPRPDDLPTTVPPGISPERSAMDWIHRLGGTFGGATPGSDFRHIGPADPFPDGRFDLVVVNLDRQPVPLKELSRLDGLPSLTTISLAGTMIDDAALTRWRELPNLQNLYLSDTRISDAGLRHLERFTRLMDLHVSFTAVTDVGLASLAAWPRLSILFLGGCDISDRSVELLAGKTNLRHLHLNGTKFSREGVERLRAALPLCRIESDFGVFTP